MSTQEQPPPQISADELAGMAASISDEQLGEAMASDGRTQILDQIFGRMADHLRPEQAEGIDAAIHFKILDRPGGGYDHYEVVIRDRVCTVSPEPREEPRVTIRVKPVEFIRLVTGGASGPALFLKGAVRIDGDLILAAKLMGVFRVPRAA